MAGLLRKLRVDKSTGTYFAFAPAAFRERDASPALQPSTAPRVAPKQRPEAPPRELPAARSRFEILDALRSEAKEALEALLEASTIRPAVRNRPGSGIDFIAAHPWLRILSALRRRREDEGIVYPFDAEDEKLILAGAAVPA